jgi:diguanylate cyclase (GGDEF)-like protein
MLKLRGLGLRIVLAAVLLVALVQGVALLVIWNANRGNAYDRARAELVAGGNAIEQALQAQRQQLTQYVRLLAEHPALRAPGSDPFQDLRKLAVRADLGPSQRLQLVEGRSLRASVLASGSNAQPDDMAVLASAELLARVRAGEAVHDIVINQDGAFLVVVASIAGTEFHLLLATAFDDAMAQQLQRVTSTGVTLMLHGRELAATPLGTSVTQPDPVRFAQELAGAVATLGNTGIAPVDGRDFAYRLQTLSSTGERRLVVVAHQPVSAVLPAFERLGGVLLGLGLASLLLALAAGYLLAATVLKPLRRVSEGALRMCDGDYRQPIAVSRPRELADLAGSLNRMRASFAAREDHVVRLAYEDSLTGMPNRARLLERAEAALRQARAERSPLAVMLLDLNRFKQINDTLGHAAGDEVLKLVAARIRTAVRPADTIARFGGDEFAIALPGADLEIARTVARAINRALGSSIEYGGELIDTGASIGIAAFPEHGSDVDTLLRCADIAMYAAKRNHASYALYDLSHEVVRREHLSLLGELRRAVEESQLRAFYQPKVDIATNRVTGAEALVRWRHPTRGMLSPGDFLPYAEQTGYIRVLTRWMLAVTVRQCGAWAAAGMPLQIAVNISARDLTARDREGKDDLPRRVADLLRQHGVPPHLICLEITESGVMEDPEHALTVLHDLHALGVSLAIDDFGTGFSSMSYLKQLPVHELKIDRSFVKDIATSTKDESIVRSMTQLAHSLGLKVVAEGVEDDATLDRLRAIDCDIAQGYLIARPMRRAAFEQWVREDGGLAPKAQGTQPAVA